jgi:hypothetical protein
LHCIRQRGGRCAGVEIGFEASQFLAHFGQLFGRIFGAQFHLEAHLLAKLPDPPLDGLQLQSRHPRCGVGNVERIVCETSEKR